MKKRSKKYNELIKIYDFNNKFTIKDAVDLLLKSSLTKFNSSIDIAIHCNLDTTKSEQQFKGTMTLPNPISKKIKILLLDDVVSEEEAKAAGADHFGGLEKIDAIKQNWLDFDLIISSIEMMKHLSKLGKILGPKGLMPTPKMGTVTNNVLSAVKEFKKGKSKYSTDSFGNIHLVIGKYNFTPEQIMDNYNHVIKFFQSKKPSTVKKTLIKKVVLSTTMGPGINVQI